MLRSLRLRPQKKFQKKHREKEKNIRNGWVGLRIPGTSLRVDSVVCLGFLLMHP
jgi:hypothetical protein